MVGRLIHKPKPGNIKENESGEVVFRGSEGLWMVLVGVTGLIVVLTLWVIIASFASGETDEIGGPLLVGGAVSVVLLLGAWFARTQRREIVVSADGLIVRTREGQVKLRLTWAQIARIESRFLPSHPTQPAIMFHCVDGTSHFIDPLQVHDTSTLIWEAQRRKRIADDTAAAAKLQAKRDAATAEQPAAP